MLDDTIGRKLPRAKPVMLTFYDRLKDYPFTTTFYVREEESDKAIGELIEAIRAVSKCVLGSYKIGYQDYLVPEYREQLKTIDINAIGSHKWVVKYQTIKHAPRSFSIPGRDHTLSINASRSPMGKRGEKPDPNHPKWQALVKIFKQIGVSKTGEDILDWVELDCRVEAWPPKGAKRR